MLNERTVRAISYDAKTDVARLELDVPAAALGKAEPAKAGLLLDAKGHLVGVDLGGGGTMRVVAMLGPHEAVKETREASVEITRGVDGEAGEIRIVNARAAIRANEKNPYAG